MSSRTSIIRAKPPAPRSPQPRALPAPPLPDAADAAPVPSLAAFRRLVASWELDEATAAALLGEPLRLSPAQEERVRLMMRMDAAAPAPEWFTWPNAHPSLAGDAPADQMARLGLPAFRRVLRVLGCG